MRKDAIDAIKALEPYVGGKGADLWTLHRLNNIDKHRLIVTVGSAFRDFNVTPIVTRNMAEALGKTVTFPDLFLIPADNLFPLENGKELFIDLPDAEPNDKIQFRFDVALHESGVIEGKPVLETLVQFRDRVSSIIDAFRPCLS